MIGVIADDLTGAAELGAVGLRHGLRAEVILLGSQHLPRIIHASRTAKGGTSDGSDLMCITTESRSLSPKQAAARAGAATRLLRTAGAKWIYKKTDSVLRGQVTAELEAILKELGCRRALLLPANPALGRTIRDGRYFIHGKAINRTDFARDPEHPRRSANVLRLLAQSKRIPIRVLQRGEAFSADGVLIGEVSSPADVKRWVARREPDMLLAGGAETFAAALRECIPGAPASQPANFGCASLRPAGKDAGAPGFDRELFVCGSASEACREFVAQSRRNGVPVVALPQQLTRRIQLPPAIHQAGAVQLKAAVVARGRVILHVGLPPLPGRKIGRRLTMHLADLAATTLRAGRVAHVFAEGGETAAALLRRMGWTRLKLLCELAPGVATLKPAGGAGVRLTIKPGSYRWPAAVSFPS